MINKLLIPFILISLAFAQGGGAAQTRLITQETLVTTLQPEPAGAIASQFDSLPWGYHIQWSPDMKRVAYWKTNDKGMFLIVNGVAGKPFDIIDDGSPRGALEPPTIVFSPDSQHFAYIARRGKKYFVVRDGKEGRAYDWIARGDLHFSSDSRRMAYWAKRGRQNIIVLHDGAKVSETAFNPKTRQTDQAPASNKVAINKQKSDWRVIDRGRTCVVLFAGKESPAYDFVHTQTLSYGPDGHPAAWCAERDGKLLIDVDGIEADKTYSDATGLRLPPLVFDGPDSLHTLALRGKEVFRVEVRIVHE